MNFPWRPLVLTLALVALWAGCVPALRAQSTTAAPTVTSSPAAVPDRILYQFFFHHVMNLESVANQLDAKGKSGKAIRSAIQIAAKLTNQETATLKAISADSEAAVSAFNAQAAPLIQAGRTQVAASNTLAPAISQHLAALETQRDQAVLNHIQQLQNGFTPQRFQLLDAFIRATSKTKAVSAPVQNTAKQRLPHLQ